MRKIVDEMFNKGRLDVAPEIFGPDFVDRGHESMAEKGVADGFAAFVKAVRVALAGHQSDDSTNGCGGRLCGDVEYRDRHAPRRAVRHAAVGKAVQHEGLYFFRFCDDKIMEHWNQVALS